MGVPSILIERVKVEVGNDAGPHCLLHGEELREGNLLSLGIGDVNGRQPLGGGPADLIGLHIHPAHLALLEGVIHVLPTEVDAENRHRGSEIDTERSHLLPVHINLVLRSLGGEQRVHLIENGIAVRRLNDLLSRAEKLIQRIDATALVEQLELEATTGAITGNRRRLNNKYPTPINRAIRLGVETLHHRSHGVVLAGPIIPVVHPDEEQTLVGRVAIEAGAAEQGR